jgi:peptidoglycan/LPS O-acetylase OafA/YrhL
LTTTFPTVIKGGFVGVDVFFVISGFLISSIILKSLESGNFSFFDFYCRRINRIFPTLILVLVFSLALGWKILLPAEYSKFSMHVIGGAGFVSNFILWKESGYFDVAAEAKPLLHLWSLGIEEQFYIIWPLLLWLAHKYSKGTILTILCIGSISFILNIYNINDNPIATFYFPVTRFWELTVGAILAFGKYRSSATLNSNIIKIETFKLSLNLNRNFTEIFSFFGVLLLSLSITITSQNSKFPGWYALLPTIGTFLIILSGKDAWFNKNVLSNKILVRIGLISFPLYLWHWPVFVFTQLNKGDIPPIYIRWVLIFISFIFAWLSYQFIEKWLRFQPNRVKVSSYLVILMLIVSLIALIVSINDGVKSRFSPLIQNLINSAEGDVTKNWRVGTCHLLPDQGYEAFNKCESEPKSTNKPTLMIWGDSHGAHLYKSILARFSKKYRIIQMTASTCPPILNMSISVSPHCLDINNKVLHL